MVLEFPQPRTPMSYDYDDLGRDLEKPTDRGEAAVNSRQLLTHSRRPLPASDSFSDNFNPSQRTWVYKHCRFRVLVLCKVAPPPVSLRYATAKIPVSTSDARHTRGGRTHYRYIEYA